MNTKHGNRSLIAGGYGLHGTEKALPGSNAESDYPNGDQGSSLKHGGCWSLRDYMAQAMQCDLELHQTVRSTSGKGRRRGEQKSMWRPWPC